MQLWMQLWKGVLIVWALPYTLLGVMIGTVGLLTGGRVQRRGPALEFYGGATQWLIQRLPSGQFVLALTLGHSILGQTDASLDVAREHEWVHVRQFERWGPFMGPAYLLCSLWLYLRGEDPYRGNPFEKEAYGDER